MKIKLITALLLITAAATAGALQSDNSKPIEIAADHFSGDQVSQTAVYTGRVEVHQVRSRCTATDWTFRSRRRATGWVF